MKKKIGILTQPLHNNYGGLLQAYALQETLKHLGHEPWIINRKSPKPTLARKFGSLIKRGTFKYVLGKGNIQEVIVFKPKKKEKEIIGKHTSYFKNKYIKPITPEINSSREMKVLKNFNFEAYVVGSDQVWRPKYSSSITNYFLDFIAGNKNVKKISYAASFGVAEWEFSKRDTIRCSKLAKQFDAISVRESSGLQLCEKYLDVNSTHVLDPTMLLNVQDYSALIKKEKEPEIEGSLMTYVLDKTDAKKKFIDQVAQKLSLTPFTVMQKEPYLKSNRCEIEKSIFPPVTKWLKGIQDSNFIVTDSFHGCAFSILYNKPFLAIGNEGRGLARFESILKKLGLEERLVTNFEKIDDNLLYKKIDWARVNTKLEQERKNSLQFLRNELS